MANLSQQTQDGEISVLNRFDEFCKKTWNKSRDEIIQHVKSLEHDDEREDEKVEEDGI